MFFSESLDDEKIWVKLISQGTAFVDSKEDMFVDAPEELNFDTPSKEALTTDDDDDNVKSFDFFFLIYILLIRISLFFCLSFMFCVFSTFTYRMIKRIGRRSLQC